jgi:hypothetical protein
MSEKPLTDQPSRRDDPRRCDVEGCLFPAVVRSAMRDPRIAFGVADDARLRSGRALKLCADHSKHPEDLDETIEGRVVEMR